ncbi:MAG: S8 family serine peptidase [Candidatus Zixiibacteriota bacterium]
MQLKSKLNNRIAILVVALIFIFSPILSQHLFAGYKPDELTCKMQVGADIEIINATYGTTIKSRLIETNCYLLMIQSGNDAESLATVIDVRPDVAYCRPNYFLTAPEPFQRSQPFLDYEGIGDFPAQTITLTLDLLDVQAITLGTDVKIAVIDGGVDFYHPLFSDKAGDVISGWDYVDNDDLALDEPGGSCSGHGTFIAGVLKLIAPEATIISYRVLDTTGAGDGYAIAAAILRAINDSCKAINLSLGMVGDNEAIDDVLQYAKDNNVMVVAAAGNDSSGSNLTFPFPASRINSIAVAALDTMNLKADFSNYGEKVDLCAPGTAIYGPYMDNLYGWWDGTSFSTPIVTALVALINSVNPNLMWDDIHNIICQTSTNIDSYNPEYEGLLGYGMVDMIKALEMSLPYMGGDANRDSQVNILDIVYIIDYLYKDGFVPLPVSVADVNVNESVNIIDITYLIIYLYKDGPVPEN